MTGFLRTASTRRLLATIAGVVVAIAVGTALAVAAGGAGPVPPKTSLAKAIRKAMAAPQISGISARIKFTNNLINASDFQGPTDPLLSGASGRLWLSNNHQFRLELQSDNGDAQVVATGSSFWIYDPASNTVYEGSLPAASGAKDAKHPGKDAGKQGLPSIAAIQHYINQFARHLNLSGAIPGDVAGRPVYTLKVSPKHDGGLLGNVQLAWDAFHGVPLRIGIYARNDSAPVLQLKVTDITYGPVTSSDFPTSPPSGAKVVKIATPSGHGAGAAQAHRGEKGRRGHADVSGVAAVAHHVPFKLVAPSSLDGLARRSTQLLNWGGEPAALVTYGQNLGGVAVIEQVVKPGAAPQTQQNSGGGPGSLSLPTVSIHGTSAQELATALGTMIRFTRGGVSYTVIGSVPPAAAELAAKAL